MLGLLKKSVGKLMARKTKSNEIGQTFSIKSLVGFVMNVVNRALVTTFALLPHRARTCLHLIFQSLLARYL